jgi:hypothetical protein
MRIFHQLRAGLVGLIAIAGVSVSSTAHADSGTILISVFKAGWFLGGSGGAGNAYISRPAIPVIDRWAMGLR